MQIIYKAEYILLKDKIIENNALLIEDGTIKKLLTFEEVENYEKIFRTINLGRALITPGFINLHTHLQYTDLTPYDLSEKVGFTDWIIDLMRQYQCWSKEKKIQSLKNGLKQTVKSGVTCVVNLAMEEAFFEIFNEQEIKTFIFLETFSNSEEMSNKEFKRLIEQYKRMNENKSENVNIGFSPHSVYNVHASLWHKLSGFSHDNNILLHTHLGESTDEINWLNGIPSGIDKLQSIIGWNNLKPANTGLNPIEYLEYLGVLDVLGDNLILAHLNQCNVESVETLVNYGAKIVHCPRSNMILHNKTLEVDKLGRDTLSNTGLGTDSKFSNYDLNILKEAKFVKDRTGLSFFEIMNLLTLNPAQILKIDHKTGSLEPGKDADFLVFQLDKKEHCENILNKECPDEIYVKGKRIII